MEEKNQPRGAGRLTRTRHHMNYKITEDKMVRASSAHASRKNTKKTNETHNRQYEK